MSSTPESARPSSPEPTPARSPAPSPVGPISPAHAAFEVALTSKAAATGEADRELVTAARAMDAAGSSATALRLLAERPRMVLRLDEAVRRTSTYRFGRAARAGARADADQPSLTADTTPLALVLASSHPDGRVRAPAVRRMQSRLRQPHPPTDLLPFLVLRTADWAAPVRDTARAALAVLLYDEPKLLIPAAAPITLLLGRRERGRFAQQQLLGAIASLTDGAAFEPLLASPDPRVRRFVLETALAGRRVPLRTLVALAKSDRDRRCRELAAEAAVREAVWTERTDVLRQLTATSHRDVRVLALIGLVRKGLASEVTPYLDDSSALVRAVARDALRRSGTDALAWYRAAVRPAAHGAAGPPAPAAGHTPTPGAIAGLAETGREEDADLLAPLLGHPLPLVRAAAVRGLRVLDAVPVERTVALLRDPSPKVIREATAALRTRSGQLPPGLGESLLADPDRAAVRRAGYRLLDEPDPLRRLRTALRVATDPDPRLARWAAGTATTLIRGLHPSPWRTSTSGIVAALDVLDLTADEQRDLLALTDAAAPPLTHRARQLLYERFEPTAPGTELLRVRHGPHPDTANPLLDVGATFTATDPHATLARIREVLLAVLPYAAGTATDWPTDDQWTDILPPWFVQYLAPGAGARTGDATGGGTEATANRPLLDWLSLFGPNGTPDSRGWRWWDCGVRGLDTGSVRCGAYRHTYAGRDALRRLVEAAGGHGVRLP